MFFTKPFVLDVYMVCSCGKVDANPQCHPCLFRPRDMEYDSQQPYCRSYCMGCKQMSTNANHPEALAWVSDSKWWKPSTWRSGHWFSWAMDARSFS